MSPTQLLEPTYSVIRRHLVEGAWPAGHRLATSHLAEEFGVSLSPVRDSLNRLAGEELVDFMPGVGFRVPAPDVVALTDMLQFHLMLLTSALFDLDGNPLVPAPAGERAADTATLFRQIADRSGNAEHVTAVVQLGDRLAPYRLCEPAILGEPEAEVIGLRQALAEAAAPSTLVAILTRYHDRRIAVAADLVRLRAMPRS
ncbi:hypothetical protein FHS96_005212 [Sphingomonas zeicaulis]|uniref:GntR family transcriptional regulator n=1 Tax=Sphingomonas zeicaulis TaxID=1632740 RepID=UPI003D22ED5B